MEQEITDADDYVDWFKWVSDAEQSKHAMFESTLTHSQSLKDSNVSPSRK
jgi:hypothetical protein